MLRLDIRVGDTVTIGDDVVLTLERKSGQTARISIQASPALKIRQLQGRLPGVPERPS